MQILKSKEGRRALIEVSLVLAFLSAAALACAPVSELGQDPIAIPTETDQPLTPAAPTEQPTSTPTPPAESADLIFHNGVILTMDENQPGAEAVAIAGDRIVAVGPAEQLLGMAQENTQIIDLEGRTLLPGFIDSHAHWIGDREHGGISDPDQVVQTLLSSGYTSVNELFVNQERLDELVAFDQDGRLPVRVNAYLPINYRQDRFGDWYLEYDMGSRPSPNVRIAGIKIFMDHGWGGIENFNWTAEEVAAEVLRAHEAGYQIAVHTIHPEAHTIILDAFEAAYQTGADNPGRHRIEHVVALTDEDLARMASMDVIASIQLNGPGNWSADPTFEEEVTPDLYPVYARWRDLLSAGVQMAGSSDWPWLPDLGETPRQPGSPILLLYQAETRVLDDQSSPPAWMLDQTISVRQALPLLTINGAYGTHEEDQKGSITPGKWADLVVLSDNPIEVPQADLLEIQIQMTMIGGQVEYCAAGQEAVCDQPDTDG